MPVQSSEKNVKTDDDKIIREFREKCDARAFAQIRREFSLGESIRFENLNLSPTTLRPYVKKFQSEKNLRNSILDSLQIATAACVETTPDFDRIASKDGTQVLSEKTSGVVHLVANENERPSLDLILKNGRPLTKIEGRTIGNASDVSVSSDGELNATVRFADSDRTLPVVRGKIISTLGGQPIDDVSRFYPHGGTFSGVVRLASSDINTADTLVVNGSIVPRIVGQTPTSVYSFAAEGTQWAAFVYFDPAIRRRNASQFVWNGEPASLVRFADGREVIAPDSEKFTSGVERFRITWFDNLVIKNGELFGELGLQEHGSSVQFRRTIIQNVALPPLSTLFPEFQNNSPEFASRDWLLTHARKTSTGKVEGFLEYVPIEVASHPVISYPVIDGKIVRELGKAKIINAVDFSRSKIEGGNFSGGYTVSLPTSQTGKERVAQVPVVSGKIVLTLEGNQISSVYNLDYGSPTLSAMVRFGTNPKNPAKLVIDGKIVRDIQGIPIAKAIHFQILEGKPFGEFLGTDGMVYTVIAGEIVRKTRSRERSQF